MPPPPPPFRRLISSFNLVKCSWNILQRKSFRSAAYPTCSAVADSSSDTSHPPETLGKFKVINKALGQLKRERSSALLFLRELQESGFKHDLETYMAVVRLLCHWDWGINESSNNLLNDVIDHTNWEVEICEKISGDLLEALMEENLIKAVQVLVELYASAGMFGEAAATLAQTAKYWGGLMVSTETCNFVMKEMIKQDEVYKLAPFYNRLKRQGLILNLNTYGIVINGLCKDGCLEEAGDLFKQMKEAGVEPNASVYSMYIHGLCSVYSIYVCGLCSNRETDLAFQVVKNLRGKNELVSVYAYASIIGGFLKQSRLQDAEDVFLEMKLAEVVPDAHCYSKLIGEYCKKKDVAKALDLCKEMESRGVQFDHMFVRWMMHSLCGLEMLDEALNVFKHFLQQSRVFLDGASFKIAIDAACKLGKMDDFVELVEEMKGRKIRPLVLQPLGLEPKGFQDQCVQPNMGQDEGAEGVPNVGVPDRVVQDDMDEAAAGYGGPLHTIQQTLALHQLTSLNANHAEILKKFRETF